MAFTGWRLSEAERTRLLALFPPRYPDVVAHHVTERFGVPETALPPAAASLLVTHVADDGKGVQALVVAVNGQSKRADGRTYHVTWSLDRSSGAKPMHSNRVIEAGQFEPVEPVLFRAEPAVMA